MLTILWKTPNGGEEIYVAPSVSKIPAEKGASSDPTWVDKLDCHGREHLAFRRMDGVNSFERTLIDMGDVFVMNADGKTVATYRF